MSDAPAPTRPEEGRYTVVYKGDPSGNRILNGEPAVGRAVGVMLGDLIERAAQAETEVSRLKARLEIDHAYDGAGNRIPFPEGMDHLDGIACRDETIKLVEAEVARLTAALAEAERERDGARLIAESWEATAGAEAEIGNERQASASSLRERVATLEAKMDQLRKDNERLRWRHPAVMPDWNDLPDGLRAKLARAADGYDPDWGGDLAVNMYATLRQAMMEAPHADN